MGHLLWRFVLFVLGFLGLFSLSQALEEARHEFVLLTEIARQGLEGSESVSR